MYQSEILFFLLWNLTFNSTFDPLLCARKALCQETWGKQSQRRIGKEPAFKAILTFVRRQEQMMKLDFDSRQEVVDASLGL